MGQIMINHRGTKIANSTLKWCTIMVIRNGIGEGKCTDISWHLRLLLVAHSSYRSPPRHRTPSNANRASSNTGNAILICAVRASQGSFRGLPALRAILGDFSGVRSGWTGVAVQFSRILAGHAGASGIGAGTTVTHRAQTTNTIPGAGAVMALNWN